jgi:hypothetical protein
MIEHAHGRMKQWQEAAYLQHQAANAGCSEKETRPELTMCPEEIEERNGLTQR